MALPPISPYYCSYCDGSCCLHYDNGDVEQSVDLHVVEWCYGGRSQKSYRTEIPNTQPSASTRAAVAVPKICPSSHIM